MKRFHAWMRRKTGFAPSPRSSGPAQRAAAARAHPYDSAAGTIALGVGLTALLVMLVRQLAG